MSLRDVRDAVDRLRKGGPDPWPRVVYTEAAPQCPSRSPRAGWHCTGTAGHGPRHASVDGDSDRIVAVWEEKGQGR